MDNQSVSTTEPGLLAFLRTETADDHRGIDSMFSSLSLDEREGFGRFLAGHAIGWAALEPQLRQFAREQLDRALPDYPGMLAHDLREMGIDAAGLPKLAPPEPECPVAVSYVLAGSRMGIALIRRQPNWSTTHGMAGRYLADPSGPDLFRALRDWMESPAAAGIDRQTAARAARGSFRVFADAFALSIVATSPAI